MMKPTHLRSTTLLAFLLLAGCSSGATEGTTPGTAEQGASSSGASIPFSGTRTRMDTARSTLTFTGGSTIIDHQGRFGTFAVTLEPDAADPVNVEKTSVSMSVDIASIQTDTNRLTTHLLTPEFFDAAQFPQATFRSTSIQSLGGNTYAITGDLIIKGTTKSVTLDATVTDDGITASFDLPRRDFGIGNDVYGEKILDALVPVEAHVIFE